MSDADTKALLRDRESKGLEPEARLREARLELWRNCLLSLGFSTANHTFTVETCAVSEPFSDATILTGLKLANAQQAFNLVVPEQWLEDVVAAAAPGVSFHALDEGDLILVLEQVFSDPLEQVARLLGSYCHIVGVETDLAPAAANAGYQFFATATGGAPVRCAVLFDDKLEARVIERIEPLSSPHEKTVASELDVRIGPIILDRRDVARLQAGHILDCGVQPTDQIRGLLMRSDGQFWPGFIDDTGINISGSRQPLDYAKARQLDAVIITLGFAEAALDPVGRMKLGEGGFVPLHRHPDNFVQLHANERAIGSGQLVVHGGNLGVRISMIGLQE